MTSRCNWCRGNALYTEYHDREWGVPLHNDHALFRMLCLEGMQAGLSWLTILQKRPALDHAFSDFIPERLVHYNETDIEQLRTNPQIIRNALKIRSVITNAQQFIKIREHTSFNDYLWQFTDGQVIQNHWRSADQIPTTSPQSIAMAKQLKQHGFKFFGPTISYAFMQAVGMVNDHVTTCFRHAELVHQ